MGTKRILASKKVNKVSNKKQSKGFGTNTSFLGGKSRSERIFTDHEMNIILNRITPFEFKLFVRFAFYTGCTLKELITLDPKNIHIDYIKVKASSTYRYVPLIPKAKAVIMELNSLPIYTESYAHNKFTQELHKLSIKNGTFNDLCRTSKSLGHKSIQTTENHYAPFVPSQIGDFVV